MSGYTQRPIAEMASLHHGAVRLAAAELGIQSFGMQLLEFPAGFDGYPEHDHAGDGMEEVYVVLSGSGEFLIDGERVAVDPSSMLRIGAGATRKLMPGSDGIRLLAIGCVPGGSYSRPQPFRLEVAS